MDSLGTGDEGDLSNIPTRPMRIKILYTFDAEKTTCLARLPDTRNIPVVPLEDQSEVGIIDLQQAIEAVISASPEIVSKLDEGDFTVYTFDYSEQDVPLLGQGRLSALLGPAANTTAATKITGRVCKNMPALFSNGVKETLEVKLRLTPVPRAGQGDFARHAESARSLTPATSAGFDPNQWNSSLQNVQQNGYFDFGASGMGDVSGMSSLDELFGLSSPNDSGLQAATDTGYSETPKDSASGFDPAFPTQSHSAPGSRAGSPTMGLDSGARNDLLRHQSFSGHAPDYADQSRPGSRASVRSESSTLRRQRPAPSPSQYEETLQQQAEVFYDEDGQPRKRAKVTQTDWRGRANFGGKSGDLRVTAATASSMHMHRPIPKRASAPGGNLEPPPRVPTPVPRRNFMPHQRSQHSAGPKSTLREASTVNSDLMPEGDRMSDAIMSSPDGNSPTNSIAADGTPLDIPSSPPLYPTYSRHEPSSPGLPTAHSRFVDSGYMSERGQMSSNIIDSMEGEENRSPDAEDFAMATRYQSRGLQQQPVVKREGSLAGSTSPDFTDTLGSPAYGRRPSEGQQVQHDASQWQQNNSTATFANGTAQSSCATSPEMPSFAASQSRRGSLALPTQSQQPMGVPHGRAQATKPKQKRQNLRRSHTANDSETGSPAPSDTEGRPKGPTRSGSAVPRREVIQERLQESIAKGSMPEFCAHCGAIETPTWRVLWVKEVIGKPGPLDYVESQFETLGIEELERRAETGEVIKFIIRKSCKKTKEFTAGAGFDSIKVCNPCGLWFGKFKKMRPADKWHRKPPANRKKKPKNDGSFSTDGIEPPSEAFFTDQIVPEDTTDEHSSADDRRGPPAAPVTTANAPIRRARANSMQPQPSRQVRGGANPGSARFDGRAVQSSPVRLQGSQESPIELDLTPQPIRRLLFPSPRQAGEIKGLEEQRLATALHSEAPLEATDFPNNASLGKPVTPGQTDFDVLSTFTFDKENMPPPLHDDDFDMAALFDGSPSAFFKSPLPKTPRSQRKTHHADLLKTPTPSHRKRKPLTPNPNTANNITLDSSDLVTSPSRYFLRSTPSRLERTPGGRSAAAGGEATTPFSRQLMQMLTDPANDDAGGSSVAPFTRPGGQPLFELSDLPAFDSPGQELNWGAIDEMLSSEFAGFDSFGGTRGGAAAGSENV